MYHMPLYLILSCNITTLMVFIMWPVVFKLKKHSGIKIFSILLFYFVLNYIATYYDTKTSGSNLWISLIFNLLAFVFLFPVTISTFKEKLIYFFINLLSLVISSTVSYMIFAFFNIDSSTVSGSLLATLVIMTFYCGLIIIYSYIKRNLKIKNAQSWKLLAMIIISTVWEINILCTYRFIFKSKVSDRTYDLHQFSNIKIEYLSLITCLSLFLIILIMLFIVSTDASIELNNIKKKTKELNNSSVLYNSASEKLNEKTDEMQNSLNKLISEYDKILNIDSKTLNTTINDFSKIQINKYTQNSLFEAILDDKVSNADDVNFKINVNVEQNLPIKDLDLCRLLCNILDNSIEAAQGSNDKAVSVYSNYQNEKFTFIVENSFGTKKKTAKKHYGLGLHIVNDICKKYNGKLTSNIKNNTFQTMVELNPVW